MPKVNIFTCLENLTDHEKYEYQTQGILKGNHLQYQEEEIQVSTILSVNEINIVRIRNEDILKLNFTYPLTREGIYDIKSVSMELPLKTTTHQLAILENGFDIEYQMKFEGEKPKQFHYHVEYEVMK